MEDIVLSDAIERYLSGEMSEAERHHFETMRQNNADLDQLVVEHIFFLKQMDTYNDHQRFRETLNNIHMDVAGETKLVPLKPEGSKLVQFWRRSRRTVAVAATIAGLVSISAIGIMLAYNKKDKTSEYQYKQLKTEITSEMRSEINKAVNDIKSKDAAQRYQPSPNTRFGGTGFIIDPRGYVVTNAHVVGKKDLSVFNSKLGLLKAELMYTDQQNDLAILKITDTSFKTLKPLPYTISKTDPELGQDIFTLGYPRPELMCKRGYISSRSANGSIGNPNFFLLDLDVESGNSGSPVFNSKGVLTGIINAREISPLGYAAAIKPQALNPLLDLMRKDDKITPIPAKSSIAKLDKDEQMKRLESYVFMIEVE